MVVIQFGGQVIDEIDTLAASGLANQMPLSNAQRTDHQLLLTPRQNIRGVMSAQSKAQVSALWSGLGMAHLLIAIQGRSEHRAQLFFLVPAAVVAQGQTFKFDKFAQCLFKNRFQGLDVSAPKFVDFTTAN